MKLMLLSITKVVMVTTPTEITLRKHTHTKHQTQNTEKVNKAKIVCYGCNTLYNNKKGFTNQYKTGHNLMKPFSCEKCGENFQDKNKHRDHLKHHKQDISFIEEDDTIIKECLGLLNM